MPAELTNTSIRLSEDSGGIDDPGGGFRIGYVQPEGVSLTLASANLLGGGFGALKIQIAYGNLGTFLRCCIANLLSDATAAAGYQDTSILKAHLCPPTFVASGSMATSVNGHQGEEPA